MRHAKNVLMEDGTYLRIPGDQAEQLIASGKAKHYVSKTVYRAWKLGIEIKDPKTRDEDGQLRDQIKEIKKKLEIKRKKLEAKRKKLAKQAARKRVEEYRYYDSLHD